MRPGERSAQMHMKIRDLEKGDRPKIAALIDAVSAFPPAEKEVAMELLDEALENPEGEDYFFFLAEEGKGLIGFLCYGPASLTDAVYDLYWIATRPGRRRKGVGRILFEELTRRLREKGGRMIVIETSSLPRYAGARAFYQRMGCVLRARIDDYYSPGDAKLIYTFDL